MLHKALPEKEFSLGYSLAAFWQMELAMGIEPTTC